MAGENVLQDKKMVQFRSEYKDIMELYGYDPQFVSLMNILHSTESSIAMNRIWVQKLIDTSWVEAIELGLIHLDNILRKPGRTIEDVEEIVPIALSRKITVESVKHLAQHTDLIQSVDEVTGRITPSKILNVHKEETLFTYENKFINTLVERLRIFINLRYEKLAEVAADGEIIKMSFSTTVDDLNGGKTKIEINIENEHDLEKRGVNTYSVWQRVERLKTFIEGYKESELCKTLGTTYIRPPVMRTNAIMKNVDMKACLTLWQYIESYDKVGYEINIEDSAMEPNRDYLDDFYELIGLHMLLFRASESPDQEILETKKQEPVAPKILRQFGSLDGRFDFTIDGNETETANGIGGSDAPGGSGGSGEDSGGGTGEGSGGRGSGSGGRQLSRIERAKQYSLEVIEQIKEAIKIEKAYQEDLREKALAAKREAQERELRRLEEERIEAARKAELERIAAEKAEKERQIKEMLELERKKHEQEERERIAMLEKKRKEEEAERARQEEERKKRIRAENKARERLRLAKERHHVREVFGAAYGVKVEELDLTEYTLPVFDAETADMSDILLQNKIDQQQREKERAETEYARRLDIDRMYFENKEFRTILHEYTYDPIWLFIRAVQYVLAMVFNIIPEKTDRPDFKQHRKDVADKKEQKKAEKAISLEMEKYYKKYAQSLRYSIPRSIDDIKFKRKRLERLRKNPKKYVSKYTPEQQKEIQQQMRAMYKEYHVSIFERARRRITQIIESVTPRITSFIDKIKAIDPKKLRKTVNVSLTILTVAVVTASVYIAACVLMGNVVNVFGYSVLKVETGSMEPTLHVDDYIIIRRCDPNTLMQGDIVSYYSEAKDISDMLVTHRIEAILPDRTYIMRGDANPVSDELPVNAEHILGVYVRKSYFYKWLGSFGDGNKIFLLFVFLPLTLVSIYELRSMIRIAKQAFAESDEDVADRAKREYEERMRRAIDKEKRRLEKIQYLVVANDSNEFVDEYYQEDNDIGNEYFENNYFEDEFSNDPVLPDSNDDQQTEVINNDEFVDEYYQEDNNVVVNDYDEFSDEPFLPGAYDYQPPVTGDEYAPPIIGAEIEPPVIGNDDDNDEDTENGKNKKVDEKFGNTETGFWWENIEDTYLDDNDNNNNSDS